MLWQPVIGDYVKFTGCQYGNAEPTIGRIMGLFNDGADLDCGTRGRIVRAKPSLGCGCRWEPIVDPAEIAAVKLLQEI